MNLENYVMNNIMIAFNHIENAHAALTERLTNEKMLNERNRNELYDYGLENADFHKIKLANVKKSLMSITENKRLRNTITDRSDTESEESSIS